MRRTATYRTWACAVVSLALGLTLAACGGATRVQVASAQSRTIDATVGGLGTVAAASDVPVVFDVPGVKVLVLVESVEVALGSHVTAGQPLITIDPAPLVAAASILGLDLGQAQNAAAAAQVRLAAASQGTQIAELQNGVASAQQKLSQAEAALATADSAQKAAAAAEVTNAQTALANLQVKLNAAVALRAGTLTQLQEAVAAANARANLAQQAVNIANGEQPVIAAPVAGYVAAVKVQSGLLVSPGTLLVQIVDPAKLQVTATLPITDVSLATVGAPVELSFTDLPSVYLTGTVLGAAPTANNAGTGFQVLIQANNTPDNKVLPGLQAYVQISRTLQAAVAVPEIAISNIDQDPTVFVVHGNVVLRQPIVVGVVDNTYAQVVGGLSDGAEVVTVGYQTLTDGSQVSIQAKS